VAIEAYGGLSFFSLTRSIQIMDKTTTPPLFDLRYDPPLPAKGAGPAPGAPFIQSIQCLNAGGIVMGKAIWHAPDGAADGVFQILHLQVRPELRRQGLGGRLLEASIIQATQWHRARRIPLRRAWLSVEQKSQVIARAFLTQHGFHHIATASNLHKDQDALIYIRAFD
jgi:GNAT superfamily N-acetyltransferase